MKYGAVTDLLVANDKNFWETKNGANGDGLTFGLASDQKRYATTRLIRLKSCSRFTRKDFAIYSEYAHTQYIPVLSCRSGKS